MTTRRAAVAGTFYPADPRALRAAIDGYLSHVKESGPVPKALIAPHAGYRYSGPIAASAYGLVRDGRGRIERVVLLGPAHRVCVRGMATSTADSFDTPLGPIAVDREAVAKIESLPRVQAFDRAHEDEHSLEVHLPFIKATLGDVKVVPIAVGDATVDEVANVLDALWGGPESLVVVSSDLSHYLDYASARAIDEETTRAVESLAFERIGDDQACGRVPMRGLLAVAARRGLSVRTLDVRNSGDTSGKLDWVVGYGAWAVQ
jgi:AmmeMemoRadiSam system protein B